VTELQPSVVAAIAIAVVRERTLARLVDVVLDQTVSALGARFAYAHRADEERRTLQLLGLRNVPADLASAIAQVSFDAPLAAAHAAAERRAEFFSSTDALAPSMEATRDLLIRTGCHSLVALPLVAHGRLVGVLTLALPQGREFGRDEREALTVCSEVFAVGIANGLWQEEREEAERLREEWASIVAHDLRQPLNVITSYVGLLPRLTAPLDRERLRLALAQLQRGALRLDRMIGDLAEASRIVTRRLVLESRPCDLGAIVREAVERQQALHPDRVFRLAASGGLPPVTADPMRIEQVLDNLLLNAVEHGSGDQPVRVELRLCGDAAQVRVTNGGPQIPPEELPKLFRRYYRARSAASGPSRSLGLGLYIARGIIEAHGGRIWAESRPEETAFEFALPLPAA